MNAADILHVNWRAVFHLQRHVLDVGDAFEITATAYEIFCRCDLKRLSAYVAVTRLYARHEFADRNSVREHRFAADKLHFRRGDESSRNRISDLVLDKIGRSSLPIGINDYLHIAQIRNRIQRRLLKRVDADTDHKKRENKHEEPIPHTRGD